MTRHSTLSWTIVAAVIAALAALATLTVLLWPPGLVVGLLLAALIILPTVAVVAMLSRQRERALSPGLSATEIVEMSDADLAAYRLQAMADFERRLELRELRLARQTRTSRLVADDYLDLLETNPSDEDLDALVGQDRKLITLIEEESQLAFDRILQNRYAAQEGVDTGLILADLRDFVEKVARLYQPDSKDILLETEIELIAKSFSSASLHLLMVVDGLPLNLKTYNTARMYRLIRRSVKYYGTYKAFRPYLEHGLNAFQVARLSLGMNPVTVGAAWLAGKLATHGAKVAGEKLFRRTALQLLNDFIRVIGFEAAMMYGSGFRHRDANWIFGAELVNLEIGRGADLAGRDASIEKLCSLVLRNEFDRVHLLSHLARHKKIDVTPVKPLVVTTRTEREHIVAELAAHCAETGVNEQAEPITVWRRALEDNLGLNADDAQEGAAKSRKRGMREWLSAPLRKLRRKGR
mgnify:CR=1 FL=1|tara:strand:- start:7154 stop:8551 length:1398 start_codon:yes stop_codon:yes gene_type:complete